MLAVGLLFCSTLQVNSPVTILNSTTTADAGDASILLPRSLRRLPAFLALLYFWPPQKEIEGVNITITCKGTRRTVARGREL